MKINILYSPSSTPDLFGYLEFDGKLHFKHIEGIYAEVPKFGEV